MASPKEKQVERLAETLLDLLENYELPTVTYLEVARLLTVLLGPEKAA